MKKPAAYVLICGVFLLLIGRIPAAGKPSEQDIARARHYGAMDFDPAGKTPVGDLGLHRVYADPILGPVYVYYTGDTVIRPKEGGRVSIYRSYGIKQIVLPGGRSCLYEIATGRITWSLEKDTAPDFALAPVGNGTANKTAGALSLSAQRGKVVYVVFWAEWCPYCPQSMKQAQQYYDTYRERGLVVWSVNVELKNIASNGAGAREFLSKHNITFPALQAMPDADPAQVKEMKAYNIDGIPASFLIDKKGTVQASGGSITDTALIEKLLAE